MRIVKVTLFLAGVFLFFSCTKLPTDDFRAGLVNKLQETNDFIILTGDDNPTETLLFYPGGLVDPMSYLKWQDLWVSLRPSLRIVTVRMPSNLAVLNAQKGARLFDFYPSTEKWLVGGHSLGGALATNLVDKHRDQVDALVYLAAYPASDRLVDFEGTILSIYAERDGLATVNKIQERKPLLPLAYDMENALDFPSVLSGRTLFYLIEGGNHAQFGNYGEQDGDLPATLSSSEQQEQIVLVMNELLERL